MSGRRKKEEGKCNPGNNFSDKKHPNRLGAQ
jgi:hypothetical protein